MKKASSKTAVAKSLTSGPPETQRGYSAQDHADRALCRAWSGTSWRAGHSEDSCRATIIALTGITPTFSQISKGSMADFAPDFLGSRSTAGVKSKALHRNGILRGTPAMPSRKLHQLDTLRGQAALVVVAYHFALGFAPGMLTAVEGTCA